MQIIMRLMTHLVGTGDDVAVNTSFDGMSNASAQSIPNAGKIVLKKTRQAKRWLPVRRYLIFQRPLLLRRKRDIVYEYDVELFGPQRWRRIHRFWPYGFVTPDGMWRRFWLP